jgi:hypothetical protein
MPSKKTILVVKSLRDLSPKKSLLVSRDPDEEDVNDALGSLGETSIGNHSPTKPKKTEDGKAIMSRSILGDPRTFVQIDNEKGGTYSRSLSKSVDKAGGSRRSRNMPVSDDVPESRSSRQSSRQSTPRSDLDLYENDDGILLSDAEYKESYFEMLKKQSVHADRVRSHDVEREATLTKFLPVCERFDMNKEKKVMTLWEERQRDWAKIEEGISKKIGAGDSHTLMMLQSDEYR